METGDLLREVCHVRQTRSVRIAGMRLLDDTALVNGIADREVAFSQVVGHLSGATWEIVAVTPTEGGVPVAQDAAGNVLGVLGRFGKGRTAVLGFGPEQDKYFAKRELAPMMMDNLLGWLLDEKVKSGERTWPGTVEVSLPARAEGIALFLNGEPVADPQVKEFGSLKKVKVNVESVAAGKEAAIRLTYKPLADARNVETLIHICWQTLADAAGGGTMLREWPQSGRFWASRRGISSCMGCKGSAVQRPRLLMMMSVSRSVLPKRLRADEPPAGAGGRTQCQSVGSAPAVESESKLRRYLHYMTCQSVGSAPAVERGI